MATPLVLTLEIDRQTKKLSLKHSPIDGLSDLVLLENGLQLATNQVQESMLSVARNIGRAAIPQTALEIAPATDTPA